MASRELGARFFAADTLAVARALVGATLEYGGCGGLIVETEAYKDDAASHYVTRKPSAGALMGTTWGRVYVYRIYGLHRCLNFTSDADAPGAVLIRALEPTVGLDAMRRRRGVTAARDLCSGPGKLCQALGIELTLNGAAVAEAFTLRSAAATRAVDTGPRVGIGAAVELPWRFRLRGSRYVSRP